VIHEELGLQRGVTVPDQHLRRRRVVGADRFRVLGVQPVGAGEETQEQPPPAGEDPVKSLMLGTRGISHERQSTALEIPHGGNSPENRELKLASHIAQKFAGNTQLANGCQLPGRADLAAPQKYMFPAGCATNCASSGKSR
jgi:hypothetical protein